jgi:LuxR family maltose regulon positive regulatory protein
LPGAVTRWRRSGTPRRRRTGGWPPGCSLTTGTACSLGSTEFWAAGEDPERHLELGVALARRIGRPFLEFTGLAYQAAAGIYQSFTRAAERGGQAVELAERHGWAEEQAAGLAYVMLGAMLAWQMRPGEAESWVQRAERVLRAEPEPAAVLGMHRARGVLELARGRDADALAAFQAAERLGGRLTAPHMLLTPGRALLLHTLVRLGEIKRAEQTLAGLGEHDRDRGETRIATAVLRLAQHDPHAAMAALAPVLDGSAPLVWPAWLAQAFLLDRSYVLQRLRMLAVTWANDG